MGSNIYLNLIVGFMIFGLFSVLIIIGIYGVATNYGLSDEKIDEATGGALDIEEYREEMLETDTSAENYRERFESGAVDDVDDASGIFAVGGDLVALIITPFDLLAKAGKNLIGIPEIVTHTVLAILNLAIIFGIWSVLRKGD